MNRNYLILGASSDIGLALIEYLNNNETDIQIMARCNSSKGNLGNIKMKNSSKMVILQCDLADEDSINVIIDNIKQNGIPYGYRYDRVHCFIHFCTLKRGGKEWSYA